MGQQVTKLKKIKPSQILGVIFAVGLNVPLIAMWFILALLISMMACGGIIGSGQCESELHSYAALILGIVTIASGGLANYLIAKGIARALKLDDSTAKSLSTMTIIVYAIPVLVLIIMR